MTNFVPKHVSIPKQLCAASLLALSVFTTAIPLAQAEETPTAIHIKTQPLNRALLSLGEQSGIVITLPRGVGANINAPELKGTMTPEEAIQKLLRGTNLEYRYVSETAVVVKEKAASVGEDASARRVSPILDEVIVTAEKRAESLQDIPIAISAFSGDTIERAGVTGVNDLKQLAPSLQLGERNQANITMRGVGQQTRNIGAESGVVVSENGVPWATTALFGIDFLDIERVEVLRGPQGTIQGRNATGGAINVYANRPTEEFEASVKATLGNYSRSGLEGYVSGPMGETVVLGRLAYRAEQDDGWLENTFLNEEVQQRDEQQLRASFLVPLNDTVEAHLILEAQKSRAMEDIFVEVGRLRTDTPTATEAAGFPLNEVDDLEFQMTHSPKYDRETYKAILTFSWDISSTMRLTSTTGYARMDEKLENLDSDGILDISFVSSVGIDISQLSEELTLTADLTDRLDVIFGGMYLHSESEMPLDIALPSFGIPPGSLLLFPEQELDSYAIYTQWRYRLTDNLKVALSGRYTYDRKDFFENDFLFSASFPKSDRASWSVFTPRLALDYTPSDDFTLYASASRGYKAGGFDTYANFPFTTPDKFDPEFVWSYEAGAKAHWFDRKLRTAFSIFYMDYEDFQASTLRPGPTGVVIVAVENAAAATIKGVEVELEALVTEKFKIAASGTWLDATFDSYESPDPVFPELNDPVTGLRNFDGNRLPRAPRWQFNVSGEYTATLGGGLLGTLRADYQWQDGQFFDVFNTPTLRQKDYGVLNFHAALESEDQRWELGVFARNVFDKRYSADMRSNPDTVAAVAVLGTPRIYGVSLTYNW